MKKRQPSPFSFLRKGPKFELLTFSHRAMATIFEIRIVDGESGCAEQASKEAFDELDRIEQALSRFVPTSEVSQINALRPGEPLTLGPWTYDCLRLARRVWRDTNGAFDVTIGPLLRCWKEAEKKGVAPSPDELRKARKLVGMNWLRLDDDEHSVTVLREGVQVDLGGIGKGYAVDRMIDVLRDWGIDRTIAHGGKSSVFAAVPPKGYKTWDVTIRDPESPDRVLSVVALRNRSLSGSGVRIHGHHIIDPRTGAPAAKKVGAWAVASSAALSDALSTAFMVMSEEEVKNYCAKHRGVAAFLAWPARPHLRVVKLGETKWFTAP